MGLLDDAIREHLDLKRARGGDPAEIERMEREALGPVRREPTIGSTRFEAHEEPAAPESEIGYPDDRDQLLGYHDSTAPHAHPHHAEPHHAEPHHEHADPYFEHAHADPFAVAPEEAEQPKRRFLRRNRAAPPTDIAAPDPGFHEEPAVDPHELLGNGDLAQHHELPGAHEPYEHADPFAHPGSAGHEPLGHEPAAPEPYGQALHHESLAHHDLHEAHEPSAPEPSAPTPPHLQFEHPPKRPRFTAEPPSLHPETDGEPATGTHEPAEAAPAHPAQRPEPAADVEVQETTEFDVQQHIAETRFQPDPEPQPHPAPQLHPEPQPHPHPARPAAPSGPDVPADEQEHEDVLEETPEFLQDTPEHDRLWFEQRPPRDFDFDG